MTRRIAAVLPGSTGGVASALITGKRGAITEQVKQAFRDTGLSHLLAIAGLHLGLVGAFVFFAVRGGLALIPPIALRYPSRRSPLAPRSSCSPAICCSRAPRSRPSGPLS
jgi:competence protein ComEC